jgi:hypothetical protein
MFHGTSKGGGSQASNMYLPLEAEAQMAITLYKGLTFSMFSSIYIVTGQPEHLSSSTSSLPSKMSMMNHCHDLFLGFLHKHIRMPIILGMSVQLNFFD